MSQTEEQRRFSLEYYYKTMKNGTYVGLNPTEKTRDSIEALQKRIGVKNPVGRDELHCTLIYSEKGNPDFRPYDRGMEAEAVELKLFGENKNILVLTIHSDDLIMRHEQLRHLGLRHSFDPYAPHITLSYDYQGESLDAEILYDENGKSVVHIEFEDEYAEPLEK